MSGLDLGKLAAHGFAKLTGAQRAAGATVPVAATASGSIVLPDGSYLRNSAVNNIGVPNTAGFGVGICPVDAVGFTPLPGCTDPASASYGNYQHRDGSVMVWIPAFRFRLGSASDAGFATHGPNTISIVPVSAHADEAAANAQGYYLHRAFINGGAYQPGFFRDKYDCSANGSVAGSIQGVQPMVSGPAAGQVGFSAVGATNAYHGAFNAARTRGPKFHPETVFQADALCRISEAAAQLSTGTTWCAWYDATGVRDYPKGNDNNALKSEADVLQSGAGAVTFTSAGNATYPAFALAGSGNQLAKTTHPNNGLSPRYGSGANAVFSLASAASRARAMAGMPESGGISVSGTNLMGGDLFYQFFIDQLCVISRGSWSNGSNAGSRFRYLNLARSTATNYVGFAASCYL